jgi:2-polyprenyl-3-methyl-5-hydroxy-6-metoxy-1,4-benzoquinol methylase/tetratricopeptide (TPR) repeat protein
MNRKMRRKAVAQGRCAPAPEAGLQGAIARPLRPAAGAAGQVNRGNVHLASGDHDAAIDCYLSAIELEPEHMDAHNNLCAVLMAQGHFDAVIRHYSQILAIKPDYVEGYNVLASAHLRTGNAVRALDLLRRGLSIKETQSGKALFVLALQGLPSVASSDGLSGLIVRALSDPWGRPAALVRQCLSLIMADRVIAACVERAATAWPARLSAEALFGAEGLRRVAGHTLLRCLIENAAIDDVDMERFLTAARHALLATAASEAACASDDELAFYCALARQCFVNEYAFAHDKREWTECQTLRDSLVAALHTDTPIPPLWPVAVAAYVPLRSLDGCERLLLRDWPGAVDALLTQQVREPAEEHRLHDTIPRLTPIDDNVSVLAQAQYEESPYPRWIKSAPVGDAAAINARLRGQFPFSGFRNLDRRGPLDVLVAGCGTGQQLVDVAQRIADARVLAIDLSRTSLAYAKRQTLALGLNNIEYGQADILRLDALGRTFDIVDCCGVLHHLGDPEAGWRVLLSLLRANGLMRVALYSELARQHIVAARTFVAERGYTPTPHDIRRFRQDVLALPNHHPVKEVARSPDFFSISGCRDLVFHVQEHRFNLPRIAEFLVANGLEFLGFELDAVAVNRYMAENPHDRARTDLGLWRAFEQDHPWIFGGMYQFWIQKRPQAGRNVTVKIWC